MLVFSAFVPHPPVLIPEIGKENSEQLKKTCQAFEQLAEDIEEAEPDTIIIISPHGIIDQDSFFLAGNENLEGSFANFEHPELDYKFKGDAELARDIVKRAEDSEIKSELYSHDDRFYHLDQGVLVPMNLLSTGLSGSIKVLPVSYSWQSRLNHLAFGQAIREAADKSNKRIALIASGDLSHRVFTSEIGKSFDQTIVDNLKQNKLEEVVNIDDDMLETAAECGYRSLLILLGAVGYESKAEVLSYEAPFGIGHLVAKFEICTPK